MFYRKINKIEERGYIALITAVIISAIVMVVALLVSNSSFVGRFDTQSLEAKDLSRKVSEGCLEHARYALSGSSYTGDEFIIVGSSTCYIAPIIEFEGVISIRATATSTTHVTHLELRVDADTLETIDIQEVTSF